MRSTTDELLTDLLLLADEILRRLERLERLPEDVDRIRRDVADIAAAAYGDSNLDVLTAALDVLDGA